MKCDSPGIDILGWLRTKFLNKPVPLRGEPTMNSGRSFLALAFAKVPFGLAWVMAFLCLNRCSTREKSGLGISEMCNHQFCVRERCSFFATWHLPPRISQFVFGIAVLSWRMSFIYQHAEIGSVRCRKRVHNTVATFYCIKATFVKTLSSRSKYHIPAFAN